MKHFKFAAMGALVCGLLPPASAATIFTLDQDGCSGSCGTAPFGTVSLDQTTSTLVTVTLTLAPNERFAGTGAGDALEFNVLGTGLIIANITPSFAVGPAPDTASSFGTFLQSVACTACQGGRSSNPAGPLVFTVTSPSGVSISDFTANTSGYYFASDIVGANGKTGNVAALGPQSSVPEPGSRLQEKQLFWPGHMGGGPVIHPVTGQQYKQTVQKAVDVGLAFHLMRSFSKRKWTTLFFLAGDSDFHEAVQHLLEHEDVNLVLVGTLQTISQELRPYARNVVELDKVATQVAR